MQDPNTEYHDGQPTQATGGGNTCTASSPGEYQSVPSADARNLRPLRPLLPRTVGGEHQSAPTCDLPGPPLPVAIPTQFTPQQAHDHPVPSQATTHLTLPGGPTIPVQFSRESSKTRDKRAQNAAACARYRRKKGTQKQTSGKSTPNEGSGHQSGASDSPTSSATTLPIPALPPLSTVPSLYTGAGNMSPPTPSGLASYALFTGAQSSSMGTKPSFPSSYSRTQVPDSDQAAPAPGDYSDRS